MAACFSRQEFLNSSARPSPLQVPVPVHPLRDALPRLDFPQKWKSFASRRLVVWLQRVTSSMSGTTFRAYFDHLGASLKQRSEKSVASWALRHGSQSSSPT